MRPHPSPAAVRPTNDELVALLVRVADLLEEQQASPQRVRDYRAGAEAIARLDTEITDVLARRGKSGLLVLPGITQRVATALEEYARTHNLSLLDWLEGRADPIALFASLPGVGPQLARKIHMTLNIETLDELEQAAQDNRLSKVRGFGARRITAIRQHLAGRFRGPPLPGLSGEPPVSLLLDVDAEYRNGAAVGKLPRIAPRRLNPKSERWLPVLHTERDDWSLTAMYSNTALAHHLGRTNDWVVIYFERGGASGQRTVVTSHRGSSMTAHRVVRGRESELSREEPMVHERPAHGV